tara:strand:+ start:504 stop:1292 length:789 start_codon:yes stop_codon:yes gene_type:complete
MSRDFNEALVYSLLRDHPLLEGNPKAIAAIMGNIYDETALTEEQAFEHTTAQKGGGGYGLFQFDWEKNKSGGMRGAYNDWLEDNNIDDSTESQINFGVDTMLGEKPSWDIGGTNRKRIRKSFSGDSVEDMVQSVSKYFERAGKPHQKRVDYALGFNPDNVMNVPHAAVDDYILDPLAEGARNLKEGFVSMYDKGMNWVGGLGGVEDVEVPSGEEYYTLTADDSKGLQDTALRIGVPYSDIVKLNQNIPNLNQVRVGQPIRIR